MPRLREKRRQLVATGIAAAVAMLFVFALPAGGQQSKEPSPKEDGVGAASVTPTQAAFASGAGVSRLEVKVSNHGNMTSFLSPTGSEDVFGGQEGYSLCTGGGSETVVHGHDTGSVEGGFGSPVIQQPTAGKFPVTITRKTSDGKFELKQVWANPDFAEREVTVTMTVKNTSGVAVPSVRLSRQGDFDVGANSPNYGGATRNSAWVWNDAWGDRQIENIKTGLMVSSGSLAVEHWPEVGLVDDNDWAVYRSECVALSGAGTPVAARQDLTLRLTYTLGSLAPGGSKTVKFVYSRI